MKGASGHLGSITRDSLYELGLRLAEVGNSLLDLESGLSIIYIEEQLKFNLQTCQHNIHSY